MANDSRLGNYIDPRIYSGGLSGDFIFRSQAIFPNVPFTPERITQFSVTPEGIRYYKVAWQETWLPEHQLIQHQPLIETYWRSQNELTTTDTTQNESTTTESTEKILAAATAASTIVGGKSSSTSTFLNNLNLSNLPDVNTTSISINTIPRPNVTQTSNTKMTNTAAKLYEKMSPSNTENSTHNTTSADNAVTAAAQTILAQVLSQSGDTKDDQQGGSNEQNTYIEIPLNVVLEATIEAENAAAADPEEKSELKPHQATWRKKANSTALQLDGFDLVNIENPQASLEELEAHAREVLSSFRRKRVRFPNGAAKLPQDCFFCTKKLSNRKKLREHQFSVHFKNVGEFMCGICKQRFVFGRQLKAHMLVHSDNRNFQCQYCGLTCKRRSHLHKHVETHSKERNYRCDVCHKNFRVQAELKDHCMGEHKNETSQCNVCKQTLHTPFSVYIHSMRHSGTRDHLCETCGATFKRKQHLIAHMNIHVEVKEKMKCPVCSKEVPDRKYLRKHFEQFHKELASSYKYDYVCEVCGKDFAYKGRLDEHLKIHMDETEEERFARAAKKKRVDSLSDEILNQFSEEAIKYVDPKTQEVKLRCKLCRKRDFRMVSSFEKHILEHKAGRIPTVSHQQQTEQTTSDSPYDCDECDRTFITSKRLERHKLLHQMKKSDEHKCSRCEQFFDSRTTLQAHFRKCVASPSVSPSKGSEKRKATLKAKEQMLRQIIAESDEDDDSTDEDDIIQNDNENEEHHQIMTGAEEVVVQTEHSSTLVGVGGTTGGEGEPLVAMQQDAGGDGNKLKFQPILEHSHSQQEEEQSYQTHQTEHDGAVSSNATHPSRTSPQQQQQPADEEALDALHAAHTTTENSCEDEEEVINAGEVVVSNLQEMINDPQSNAAAFSYVMQCVNQAVIANEQVLETTTTMTASPPGEDVSQTSDRNSQTYDEVLQTQAMTASDGGLSSTNELVVVSVPVNAVEGGGNEELVMVMEQQPSSDPMDVDDCDEPESTSVSTE